MKKSVVLFVCLWLSTFAFIQAQEKMPQAISYQAVARDTVGKVLTGKNISVKVEILKGSATGAAVYTETHGVKSTATGTVNLLIGQGTAGTGTFAGVDWASDTYFLKLGMDIAGGNSYQTISTTQMLPVPYALYAAKAGTVADGGSGSNTAKFVLIAEDCSEALTAILRGEVIEGIVNPNDTYGSFGLDFCIVYLDGTDHKLNASIEKWPDGVTEGDPYNETKTTLPSTTMGRFCYIGAYKIISPGTYSLKLQIKDSSDTIIKEYPFTLKMVPYKEIKL